MAPIGWVPALWIWAYALAWFLFEALLKAMLGRLLGRAHNHGHNLALTAAPRIARGR